MVVAETEAQARRAAAGATIAAAATVFSCGCVPPSPKRPLPLLPLLPSIVSFFLSPAPAALPPPPPLFQVIGVVVAETEAQARRAARAVSVSYDPLPAILSIEDAIAAKSFYHEYGSVVEDGDVDKAFAPGGGEGGTRAGGGGREGLARGGGVIGCCICGWGCGCG